MAEGSYQHSDEIPQSIRAAERIAPVVLSLTGPVQSVVDVGGGSGAWLAAFANLGVEKAMLFDTAAAEAELVVPRSWFQSVDLNVDLPATQRFDLAVCVECAEHLHERRARPLITWLTSTSDVVVFSAAIPGQGGKGHLNERPPDYWAEIFHECGFARHDVLRSRILHDRTIPWWYRQNLFLFVKRDGSVPVTAEDFLPPYFHLVHRSVVERMQRPGLRTLIRQFGRALVAASGPAPPGGRQR
jgi:hypothetical protein